MKNYKDHITKTGDQQSEFKTDVMAVPARFFMADKLLPGDETFAQMESIATHDDLFRHTVAMPDVMTKVGRKNASGTTIASKSDILPQVNDSDPNCGMRLVRTNLTEDNISDVDLDLLFEELTNTVPTKKLVGTRASFKTIVDICRGGTAAAIEYFGIETKNELENSFNGGNFLNEKMSRKELLNTIPKLYLFFAQFRLGIIGAAGNHFVDLMKITDLVDPEIAQKFNLKKGQYVFVIHTGSGILGQYTMYTYTAKKREHLSQSLMVTLGKLFFNPDDKKTFRRMQKTIKKYMENTKDLLAYDGDSPEGRLYMKARAAASNFGTANRALITHNIGKTIKSVLNRDAELDLLYDLPHISINRETHFDNDLWVHRSNTSRANGPGRMSGHELFSKTGEPAFICSSMSTPAYLSVGMDSNDETFYSAPHGTGKGTAPSENEIPQNRDELMKKMEKKGVKLYNARSGKTIEQDSSQYKDIDVVMDGVEKNGVTKTVVKMQPVAVIMY